MPGPVPPNVALALSQEMLHTLSGQLDSDLEPQVEVGGSEPARAARSERPPVVAPPPPVESSAADAGATVGELGLSLSDMGRRLFAPACGTLRHRQEGVLPLLRLSSCVSRSFRAPR